MHNRPHFLQHWKFHKCIFLPLQCCHCWGPPDHMRSQWFWRCTGKKPRSACHPSSMSHKPSGCQCRCTPTSKVCPAHGRRPQVSWQTVQVLREVMLKWVVETTDLLRAGDERLCDCEIAKGVREAMWTESSLSPVLQGKKTDRQCYVSGVVTSTSYLLHAWYE